MNKLNKENLMSQDTKILNKWAAIKTTVVAAEEDVTKNATGNAAAGVRARKTLRTLKQDVSDLVKLTLGKDVD
jgi:hypothetical protein